MPHIVDWLNLTFVSCICICVNLILWLRCWFCFCARRLLTDWIWYCWKEPERRSRWHWNCVCCVIINYSVFVSSNGAGRLPLLPSLFHGLTIWQVLRLLYMWLVCCLPSSCLGQQHGSKVWLLPAILAEKATSLHAIVFWCVCKTNQTKSWSDLENFTVRLTGSWGGWGGEAGLIEL